MKVLLVKLSSLGDILQCYETVDYLKKHLDDVVIDWAVEPQGKDLVARHPQIRHALIFDSKRWRKRGFFTRGFWQFTKQLRAQSYDMVLDLQGNTKSALVTFLAQSKRKIGFSKSCVPEWPNLLVTHEKYTPASGKNRRLDYLYLAQRAIRVDAPSTFSRVQLHLEPYERDAITPYLLPRFGIIAPGSFWPNKQLDFAQWTLEHFSIPLYLIYGSDQERMFVEKLAKKYDHAQVFPKMCLVKLQYLMDHAEFVLSTDSLALHLAGTTSTKTYGLFGPTKSDKYAPLHTQSLQGVCPYHLPFEGRCPRLRTCPDAPCIKQLDIQNILFQ